MKKEDSKRSTSLENYYRNPMEVELPWWGKWIDPLIKNYEREEVVGNLNLKGRSCLDIACGDGVLLNKYLYKNYKHLTGVDISPDLIKIARKEAHSNTDFTVVEIESYVRRCVEKRVKFNDIYMLAILEHLFWPRDFVANTSKLLEKPGRIIVELPNIAWLPHRINLLKGDFPITAPTKGVLPGVHDEHIRFFTLKTLDQIFYENGFLRIDTDCSGRLRQLKKMKISLLAPDIVAVYEKLK